MVSITVSSFFHSLFLYVWNVKNNSKIQKKSPTLNCTTPRRKVKLRELRLSDKEEHIVQEKFNVSKNEKVCRACSYKTNRYITTCFKVYNCTYNTSTIGDSQHPVATTTFYIESTSTIGDSQHPVATTTPYIESTSTIGDSQHQVATTTPYIESTSTIGHSASCAGRPRKKFSERSASTRRRIKSKAKKLLGELVDKYNKISKGEGCGLLEEVCDKIPISSRSDTKLFEVVDGIAKATQKNPHDPLED